MSPIQNISFEVQTKSATNHETPVDFYVTDPPYADAIHYHEITEFFIAWLRKNPPNPFKDWIGIAVVNWQFRALEMSSVERWHGHMLQ
jgi:adenine-specific DNA methylase